MNGFSLFAPSLILLVALFTDLKTRKIYNNWVLASCVIALCSSFYFFGFEGLKQGSLAAMLALIMTLPLVIGRVLGAGDMKIMFAFGLASTYSGVFAVLLFSLFWAAIVGIVWALARGRGMALAKNTVRAIQNCDDKIQTEINKIPYSVALFLAWITYVIVGLKQGALI